MNLMDIVIDLIKGESAIYDLIDDDKRFVKGDKYITIVLNRMLFGSTTVSKVIDTSAEFVFSHLVDEINADSANKKKELRVKEILEDRQSKIFLALMYITKKIVVERFYEKMEEYIMDTVAYYTATEMQVSDDFEGYEHDYSSACDDARTTIYVFAESVKSIREYVDRMDLSAYNVCLVDGLKSALKSFEEVLRALDINLIADAVSDPYTDYIKGAMLGDE